MLAIGLWQVSHEMPSQSASVCLTLLLAIGPWQESHEMSSQSACICLTLLLAIDQWQGGHQLLRNKLQKQTSTNLNFSFRSA